MLYGSCKMELREYGKPGAFAALAAFLCFLPWAPMPFSVIPRETKVAVDTAARGCGSVVHYVVKECCPVIGMCMGWLTWFPGAPHALSLLLEIRGYLLDVLSADFSFDKENCPGAFRADKDYSLLSMHLVPHAFYFRKGLICAWKQGLSAKVFVMTKMKSENGWENMEGTCVWLILWVCWLAWVYGPIECWQVKSWNWVLRVRSASHCANWLLRYVLWSRWWIVTNHGYRHRYVILFR